MPSRDAELPILLRRFEGTNRQIDSVFLGPSYLRRSTNWVPSRSFVLTKRRGTSPYHTVATATRLDAMHRAYSADEVIRYLYAAVDSSAGTDRLVLSTDDAAFVDVVGGAFASSGKRYDFAQIGQSLYVGNGTDPIKQITLGGATVDLGALGSFTDGSVAPTFTNDTNAEIRSGTYSYGWAVLNHTTGLWVTRSQAREVSKATAAEQHLSFPVATGYALAANERFHLFVSPVNFPVELSTDQTPEGVSGGGITPPMVLRAIQGTGTPWPLRGVARSGDKLVTHLSRLWFAGWDQDVNGVYATNVIEPGFEQIIYNQGTFFPVNAAIRLPAPVTGLGIVAVTENDDPRSPMAIFTRTRTVLFFGDILGDPSAYTAEVSSRIGCAAHATIVATPYGLIWLGLESVYRMPPGGGAPEDIGWPIGPDIRSIPSSRRPFATATFHKGFYKLWIAGPGSLENDQGWFLDLRLGDVGAVPRWFGPHAGVSPSAFALGLVDPAELDRGFVAKEGTGVVLLHDQVTSYADDGSTLISTLDTGDLDDGGPLDKKLFTGVRVTASADAVTSLNASITTNGGTATGADPIQLSGTTGIDWGVSVWNIAEWGSGRVLDEAGTTFETDRPTGLWASVQLQHAAAVTVELRDVELTYVPVVRPKRTPGAQGQGI